MWFSVVTNIALIHYDANFTNLLEHFIVIRKRCNWKCTWNTWCDLWTKYFVFCTHDWGNDKQNSYPLNVRIQTVFGGSLLCSSKCLISCVVLPCASHSLTIFVLNWNSEWKVCSVRSETHVNIHNGAPSSQTFISNT